MLSLQLWGPDMRRRDFITFLGGATAMWPLAARAQQVGTAVRIGFLGPNLSYGGIGKGGLQVFREELHTLGLSEGQNFSIDYKNIDDPRGLSVTVAELMQSRPDILVTSGTEIVLKTAIAAKGAIPIVMIAINFDPIARGYVTSLSRPGGDITGVVFQQLELAQKQVELLTHAFPDRNRLVVLFDDQSADQYVAADRTAKSLKLQVQPVKLENPPYNFEVAFRSLPEESGQMVLVLSSPHFVAQSSRIAALAIAQRLPTMFIFKTYVEVGGLMSYGVDYRPMYRRVADDVAKIIKGAKPADVPIEQADKFDFVVNRRTAKAIGVELPAAILLRADEVIE
jgi:putative tryptophan/tyrosine transport system substrate-binding protein